MLLLASLLAPGAMAQRADADLAQNLARAQQAERAQDYAAASREYEQILKLRPNLAVIRQSLAVTYHLRNLYPEAIAEFQRALKLDPSLWGSQLFLGMDYYKSSQFNLALAPLEISISLNAKMAEPEGRFWLGVTYAALEKPQEAVVELRRAMELRPRDVEVLYRLTQAYDQSAGLSFERLGRSEPGAAFVSLLQAERFLAGNRADLAHVEYRNALQLRPDFAGWIPELAGDEAAAKDAGTLPVSAYDALALSELADWIFAQGDAEQAASLLRHLARQRPADAKAALLVAAAQKEIARMAVARNAVAPEPALEAIALIRQGRSVEAIPRLVRASENDPSSCLRLFLARAYTDTDQCELSEKTVQKVLAAEPANADALHLLGRNYKRFAALTLQKMIELDQDSYRVHELLGQQHEERTEYELALREYQSELAKRPDLGGVRYAIGNVYWKMRQYGQAEQWLNTELQQNPFHGLAHFRLGSVYSEAGKPDDAIPHLQQALHLRPDLVAAQFELGRAYAAKGRYEDAIEMLKKFAAAEPENDRVHYLLSNAYQKLGRQVEARAEMAKFQEFTRRRLERAQHDVRDASDSLNRKP